MHCDQDFSNLIYEYFLMRFKFKYYQFGDTLPPINTLCQEFCVADQTVKTALKRLRAEGYITMRTGKPTKVVFQQTREEAYQLVLRYFAQRWEAFSDLCKTMEVICIPLIVEGFRRTKAKDFQAFHRFSPQANPNDLLYYFSYFLQKLNNPLVMNLIWEIALFMGFLSIRETASDRFSTKKLVDKLLNDIIRCKKERDWDRLRDILILFQRESLEQGFRIIQPYIQPVKKEDQLSFVWRIYRDRPQICYSLALRILHEIYMGEYQEIEYLPSYEKMAEKYRVSISTIRRTVSLLTQLGSVRPINGKGILIIKTKNHKASPNFSSPVVRRNLAFHLQAFELIIYSSREAAKIAFQNLSEEKKSEMVRQLKKYLQTGQCNLTLCYLLLSIAKNSPLRGIKEIYGKVYGLFLLGYPLKMTAAGTPDLDKAEIQFTKAVIKNIKENRVDQCGSAMRRFVSREFPKAEQFLSEHGIEPDELRIFRSIRLLLTDHK